MEKNHTHIQTNYLKYKDLELILQASRWEKHTWLQTKENPSSQESFIIFTLSILFFLILCYFSFVSFFFC